MQVKVIPTVRQDSGLDIPEDAKRILIQDLARLRDRICTKDKSEEKLNSFTHQSKSRPIIASEIRRDGLDQRLSKKADDQHAKHCGARSWALTRWSLQTKTKGPRQPSLVKTKRRAKFGAG